MNMHMRKEVKAESNIIDLTKYHKRSQKLKI
jgi:hypothetical protein